MINLIKAIINRTGEPSDRSAPVSISVDDAFQLIQNTNALLVDVRTPQEWEETGIPRGAKCLPHTAKDFEQRLKTLIDDDMDRRVIFICRTGRRVKLAAKTALKAGFSNVFIVDGGVPGADGWIAKGYPVSQP